MIEKWKEFAKEWHKLKNGGGYYNIWEVSTFGRFKWNGRIVEPHYKNNDYPIIKQKRVHRIVAETFISNPEHKPCVDHIDGNIYNNTVYNLRWVTYEENNNNPVTKARLVKSQKISSKYKETRYGAKNQKWITGRHWINNGKEEKLIYDSEYNTYKKIGYEYGRLLDTFRNS